MRSKLKDGLGSKRKNLFQENGQNNPNEFILSLSKGIPLEDLRQLIQTPLTEEEEAGLLDHEPLHKKPTYTNEEIWQLITQESGTTNPTQFQALPRPQQKHILYLVHEYGIGPRTLSRLTGVPYAIVQRATSKANEQRNISGMVCESTPEDEHYYTYCDEGYFQQYPDY